MDPAVANDYDSFAEAYTAETEANLINAYYERPAMLALAGDVTGLILDAGCGSGPLFAALRDRGAMTDAFTAAGFRVAVVSEPEPRRRPASCSPTTSRPSCASCASCSAIPRAGFVRRSLSCGRGLRG